MWPPLVPPPHPPGRANGLAARNLQRLLGEGATAGWAASLHRSRVTFGAQSVLTLHTPPADSPLARLLTRLLALIPAHIEILIAQRIDSRLISMG